MICYRLRPIRDTLAIMLPQLQLLLPSRRIVIMGIIATITVPPIRTTTVLTAIKLTTTMTTVFFHMRIIKTIVMTPHPPLPPTCYPRFSRRNIPTTPQPQKYQPWQQRHPPPLLLLLLQIIQIVVDPMNFHDGPLKWHQHVHIIHGIVTLFLRVVGLHSVVEFVTMIVQCCHHCWNRRCLLLHFVLQ